MKSLALISMLSVALAAPTDVDKRQFGSLFGGGGGLGGGSTCMVFARGSTEPSPIGILIGPGLMSALSYKIPGLQQFPVYYSASLLTNVWLERTDTESIQKGVEAFNKAEAAGCKTIIAGGYSQGAAVMHNVIARKLSPATKAKIAGVALFGDTRNTQDRGHIPNFPQERSKVWCNAGDGVCDGGLVVNAAHLSYGPGTTSEAANWLVGRIQAMQRGG